MVQFNAGATVAAAKRSMILEFEVADVDAERSRLDTFIDRWELEPTSQPLG